jgi:hypothetical protein
MTPVTTQQSAWKTNYGAHLTAADSARAARVLKDDSRATFVAAVRSLVRRLQASSSVDNSERAALGITVPGENPSPEGPPESRPFIKAECERLRHTLNFFDENTPTRKAKPAGVLGAEIRMALTPIGQPTPTDPDDFAFLALDTATPYTKDFDGADGGKNAHYIARWMNTRQETGPWSETVSVTVGV